MGKKQIYFIRKLTIDYFGGFYYFYIRMIKIKYSPIVHDRGSEIIFMADIILKSNLGE